TPEKYVALEAELDQLPAHWLRFNGAEVRVEVAAEDGAVVPFAEVVKRERARIDRSRERQALDLLESAENALYLSQPHRLDLAARLLSEANALSSDRTAPERRALVQKTIDHFLRLDRDLVTVVVPEGYKLGDAKSSVEIYRERPLEKPEAGEKL